MSKAPSQLRGVNKQRALEAQKVRAEVLARGDQPSAQVAADLGITQRTVQHHRSRGLAEAIQENLDTVAEIRDEQLAKLKRLEEEVEQHRQSGRPLSLAALDRLHSFLETEIKLTGTAAPTKHLTASLTPETDPATLSRFRRFCFETRHMDAATLEKVYEFCRTLNVFVPEPAPQLPATSELWDMDEPKKLGESRP